MEIKTTIFDIPTEVWKCSGFDCFYFNSNRKTMTFKEVAQNRENYEFMKKFNVLNGNQPHLTLFSSKTGDKIQVNKGFLENIMDGDDIENAEQGGSDKAVLLAAQKESIDAQTDFTD